jgi:GNAT superfamily N-acetyltransferase
MTTVEQDVTVRPASIADRPSVLALLESSLGWQADSRNADLFAWKHEQSPFGPSPAWVAADREGQLLGFRTFLRWEFTRGSGVVRAARAVDTATRPDVQRRGIFSRLTTTAIDSLARDDVAFVFNTPNRRSLPGYLNMGWQPVGHLPVRARATSVMRWTRLAGARRPADKWSLLTGAGVAAADAFADTDSVSRLLAGLDHTEDIRTRVDAAYLRWRYGFPPMRYRIATAGSTVEDGIAVFRFRRRGTAVEAVICDLLVPGEDRRLARELCRRVLDVAGADYALCLGRPRARGFLPLPGQGPMLTWRAIRDTTRPSLHQWDLSLGDVELF